MPGILCCLGLSHNHDSEGSRDVAGSKDVALRNNAQTPVQQVTVSAIPEAEKDLSVYNGTQNSQPRDVSPAVSPSHPVAGVLAGACTTDVSQGLLQGIEVQRKITLLQGHWWTRVEGAVDLLAKTYSAACASVWILDESSECFVALLSKGPMRQAVQPGYAVHLDSEYDANSPFSLTSLWETKAARSFNVKLHNHSSSSSPSSSSQAHFPADWKLLYSAHHFTDFLALPIFAMPMDGGGACAKPSADSNLPNSTTSAGMIIGTLGGNNTSNTSNALASNAAYSNGAAAIAATNASEGGEGGCGGSCQPHIVGALTLYLSRPDRVSEQPPSIFSIPCEQDLVALALAGVLFSGGPEPVRQVCKLVLAVQSASGSGELAAAVAAGLQARLQYTFAVAPVALLALVPPKQVSAVVFRDQSPAAEAAGPGAMDSMVGCSSSLTLPLLHPALASVAGGGGGAAAAVLHSGSHSHGGGAAGVRVQFRAACLHSSLTEASAAGCAERSPSLLGTGLKGDAPAAAAGCGGAGAGGGAGAAAMPHGLVVEGGGGTGGGSRPWMPNSRSMGMLAGNNPSGLFTCRLEHRLPSRYKALVFPLSHTLLQVLLQQRLDRKLRTAASHGTSGGVAAAAARQTSALRDLCVSAAAAAAAPSGASHGGWIVSDCNEHLHAVHSPSRDIYMMARVNGRRPHSIVLATAELAGLGGGIAEVAAATGGSGGGNAGPGGGGGGSSNATYIAVYLAFPERLPRTLLELVLTDIQLLMRQLLAPLIRYRFETSLAEEWTALAGAANNLPTPGGPVLRITSSASTSQAHHVPGLAPVAMPGEGFLGTGVVASHTPPIAEGHNSNIWLARLAAAGGSTAPQLMLPGGNGGGGGGGGGGVTTPTELQLEGLSAGEALQQMSVLVSSYMDTMQALQGQLMASDRVAESLRREDLPHLQLLEVLGHGGSGVVFRGKLHALDVAVKVFEVPGDLATAAGMSINPSFDSSAGGGATVASTTAGGEVKQAAWPAARDRRVLQRSALELAVTASLSHPHIIQAYSLYTNMVLVKERPPRPGSSGVQLLELSAAATTLGGRAEEGIPCSALCMEFCDLGTLAHAIDQHRFLVVAPLGTRRPSLKAIVTSLLEVALALRHLHARNLAHGDLKPANVLLKSSRGDSRGFTCKVADFGYVSVLKAAVPGGRPIIIPEEACGTVTHMAPETFIKGQPLDFSVDTFSFGILMWELYTCGRPYSDVPEDQIAQRVTLKGLRPTFPPDTPRSYAALARQCWNQDPNERPRASEIVANLENMLQIMDTQLPAIPPLKPKTTAAAPVALGAVANPVSVSVSPGRVSDRGLGVRPQALPDAAVAYPLPPGTVIEKPLPGMPRNRGSLNGGMLQVGPPPVQSPLGRVPASPREGVQQPGKPAAAPPVPRSVEAGPADIQSAGEGA